MRLMGLYDHYMSVKFLIHDELLIDSCYYDEGFSIISHDNLRQFHIIIVMSSFSIQLTIYCKNFIYNQKLL